eukprot:TRINITY_DN1712_c0_g1_i1.p1 TRINITY_DN1712_c0_g1~~TRINITY_DN1712_c0_g1_i1.p1  ORF type:complete len:239 (+),score=98.30 TRINITY_DN1712_c0_g1_i1:75-791(+)
MFNADEQNAREEARLARSMAKASVFDKSAPKTENKATVSASVDKLPEDQRERVAAAQKFIDEKGFDHQNNQQKAPTQASLIQEQQKLYQEMERAEKGNHPNPPTPHLEGKVEIQKAANPPPHETGQERKLATFHLPKSESGGKAVELNIAHGTNGLITVSTKRSIWDETVTIIIDGPNLAFECAHTETFKDNGQTVTENVKTTQGITFPFTPTLNDFNLRPDAYGLFLEIRKPANLNF